mmetsp:Transcript_7476/g.25728  ORF Transcript_7476/g.25728 Transcript_7476/m.25728 type:complete len:108 (-) Transcript_7476:719-1042(-)
MPRPMAIPTLMNINEQSALCHPSDHQNASSLHFSSCQMLGVTPETCEADPRGGASASTSLRYMKSIRRIMTAADRVVWTSNQAQPSILGVSSGQAEIRMVNKKPPNP